MEIWDATIANGRRRVFRIEIDRPMVGDPVVKFHLERVFVDESGNSIAQSQAGSWAMSLSEALADAEIAPMAQVVANGLEAMAQKLYEREQAKEFT